MAGMSERFHFTTRNALLATTFVALWCAIAAWDLNYLESPSSVPVRLLSLFVKISMPAAVFGALLGRPWFGLACGVAGAGGYLAWEFGVFIWLRA